MKFLLGVTTYNRNKYLLQLINTFFKFKSNNNWTLLIIDDNPKSKIGKVINKFNYASKKVEVVYIKNKKNMGVHFSTNIIINYFKNGNFDFGFKCDDDIFFKKKNWCIKYYLDSKVHSYPHLTYYNSDWKPKVHSVLKEPLVSYSPANRSLGCFWTFNNDVVNKVGFFDSKNFGKRGLGHIDFSVRCCREGFNNENTFFQPKNAEDYIGMQQRDGYIESMPWKDVAAENTDDIIKFKLSLINDKKRNYIGFKI
tara:strand:+ start:1461 stop:2219 length:759 start_codon:yes stop_codon:yes gene_type:complete